MRILIVEDEIRLAEALKQIINEHKYITDVVHDGEAGYDYAICGIYDVVVLDIMLPKMNGFDVVRKMRKEKVRTPVILLTAKDEIADKVMGLDCGADDYLTKPFSPDELLARIRALARRQGEVVLNEMTYGDLTLNQLTNTLSCKHKSVHLGIKELEVLRMLMSNPKAIVPKEDILTKIWGTESDAEDNNVEVYISFLRKKFFFLGSKVTIETVRKLGYHLGESDD